MTRASVRLGVLSLLACLSTVHAPGGVLPATDFNAADNWPNVALAAAEANYNATVLPAL
jgi:hypothetical protein